uniref:F-box domain-containing protein n=1 Tax=Parascaris equorum TaxID=6256 RepID=A0A914RQR9_PAREQ
MVAGFPSTFLYCLRDNLNWLERIRLSCVSHQWNEAFKNAPRESHFVKSVSIGDNFITFEVGATLGKNGQFLFCYTIID